jgi:hypothetical protein
VSHDADGQPPRTDPPELEPLAVDTVRIVLAGTVLFAVALVVTLLVPSLHGGDRDWWPWACTSGLGLGLLGLAYIRRGRGNAAAASPARHSSPAGPSAEGARDTSIST